MTLSLRTITGVIQVVGDGGVLASAGGRVLLSTDFELYDSGTGAVVLPAQSLPAVVDPGTGAFTLTVPVNDSAGVSPSGWSYAVRITGRNSGGLSGSIAVPDGVGALDFVTHFVPDVAPPTSPRRRRRRSMPRRRTSTARWRAWPPTPPRRARRGGGRRSGAQGERGSHHHRDQRPDRRRLAGR